MSLLTIPAAPSSTKATTQTAHATGKNKLNDTHLGLHLLTFLPHYRIPRFLSTVKSPALKISSKYIPTTKLECIWGDTCIVPMQYVGPRSLEVLDLVLKVRHCNAVSHRNPVHIAAPLRPRCSVSTCSVDSEPSASSKACVQVPKASIQVWLVGWQLQGLM